MSVTISAVPVLLISTLISASISAIERRKTFDQMAERISKQMDKEFDVNSDVVKEICREYDTVFLDKEVLMKTLSEYGFDKVTDAGDQIVCKTDGFIVTFYKSANYGTYDADPYKMLIKTDCEEDKIEELIGDLSDQYTSNTQEESYNKIKERLKKHNLEISEEEVLDDNSIVLTVNIE